MCYLKGWRSTESALETAFKPGRIELHAASRHARGDTMTTLAPVQITFEHILIPTDFSDLSQRAVEYAKAIARRFHSQLLLAHAYQPINPIAPAESVWVDQAQIQQELVKELEKAGAALRAEGFQAEALSLVGETRNEILSTAGQRKVDLIVMGTHGMKGFDRLMLGSESEDVLRHAPCPVLVIGPAVPPPPTNGWNPREIICATSLDPEAAPVAAYAYALAREYQAGFLLLEIEGSAGSGSTDDLSHFEAAFKQSLPGNLNFEAALQTLLSEKKTGETIVDVAKERHADLIVMGARTASAAATHFARGTVPQVFAEAPCPVLTLRRSREAH